MSEKVTNSAENINLYWTLQVAGWGFFFLVFSAFGIAIYEFDWKIVFNYLLVTLVGFCISHFYRKYVKKRQWHKYSIRKLALRIVLVPVLLGMIWLVLVLPISIWLSTSEEKITLGTIFAMLFNLSIIFFMWNLIYFFYNLFTSYKQSEIEKWRLTAAVKEAQLMALKSQINPHFIFNSLNNIRSLVIENPEKAREMITHLSSLLRYSIQFNNMEKVSLKSEIDVVQYYLNLESIQFEDRLKVEFRIDDEALTKEIPPMAIQMLVENAIKHGISKLPNGGEISIACNIVDGKLIVAVVNTGQIEENYPADSGIGLKNATDRLRLLFGKLSELTLENINSNQVQAKFVIPI